MLQGAAAVSNIRGSTLSVDARDSLSHKIEVSSAATDMTSWALGIGIGASLALQLLSVRLPP